MIDYSYITLFVYLLFWNSYVLIALSKQMNLFWIISLFGHQMK